MKLLVAQSREILSDDKLGYGTERTKWPYESESEEQADFQYFKILRSCIELITRNFGMCLEFMSWKWQGEKDAGYLWAVSVIVP